MSLRQHVFVSYSHADVSGVVLDVEWLRSEGINVFFDRQLRAGSRWADELAHALDDARAVLFYISPASVGSRHCLDEIAYALDRDLPVIAVYYESIDLRDGLRLSLSRFHAIMRWQLNTDEYRQQLRHALQFHDEAAVHPRELAFHDLNRTVWDVPVHRNPYFVGREDILERIEQLFDRRRPAARLIALTGLGGVGKTQIALEYAYRRADRYRVIAWINAEEPQTLAAGFVQLAHSMGLPEQFDREEDVVIAAVRDWLRSNDRWLLVLDNVESQELVRTQVPPSRYGHVLMTSRRADWGSLATNIAVDVLDEQEAIMLVRSRLPSCSEADARTLVRMLDHLPLAIDESIAYVEETGRSVPGYIELFADHHEELLKRSPGSAQYPSTLGTTWEVSIQQVRNRNAHALELLELLAFYAPDRVPLSLLRPTAEGAARSIVELDMAIALLRSFSLIKTDGGGISIHRLVQMITRDRMAPERQQRVAVTALGRVEAAFPSSGAVGDMRPECRSLLPHAIACIEHTRGLDAAAECAGRLLGRTGTYLSARSWSQLGSEHLREAYDLFAKRAPGSIGFARAGELHGRNLYKLSALAEARQVFEQSVAAYRAAGPRELIRTAQPLTDLAWIIWSQGEFETARRCAMESVAVISTHGAPDDPRALGGSSILARILLDSGDVAQSRRVVLESLETVGKLKGLRHPLMGAVFIQLGQVLLYLGWPLRALSWSQESLALLDKAYGEHHPLVASAHCLLGQVHVTLGNYPAATREFEITRASLAAAPYPMTQHALIATPMQAEAALASNRLQEAESLIGQSSSLRERVAGDASYLALRSAVASARVALAQGKPEAAGALLATVDREQRYGPEHPFRIPLLNLLGQSLGATDAPEAAARCFNEARAIARRHELEHHPDAAETCLLLAAVSPPSDRPALRDRARASLGISLGDTHERVVALWDKAS